MPELIIKPKALKFIKNLPQKHKRQIKDRILALSDDPIPVDSKKLIGYDNYTRVDIGEYRIIYRFESKKDCVVIVLVGKRNDNQIYRIARRNLK